MGDGSPLVPLLGAEREKGASFSARLMLETGAVPKRVAKCIKTAFICRGE